MEETTREHALPVCAELGGRALRSIAIRFGAAGNSEPRDDGTMCPPPWQLKWV
jgi:hypothetical protein